MTRMTPIILKRTLRWSTLVGLAIGLFGCASPAEREATQTLDATQATRIRAQVAEETFSPDRLPELDPDAVLQDYLAYAALNNPQLEAAFNRWKAALEMVPQMRTLPDPRFNYGYYVQQVETRVGPQEQRVGLSQMFPWFGKLKLRGDVALNDANAMQHQYEAAKLTLFNEVKQGYYELYYLGRSITVTEENVDLLQQFEEVARSKYESGTAMHGDVIKAQVELDKLRDRLRTLNDLKHPTAARLNAALNRPASAPLPFPTNVAPATLSVEAAQLLDQLTASNPELQRLDAQAEKEKNNIALAKKEFYPDVTLGVDWIDTGPASMPNVPDSGQDALIAGFSVNLPIWWGKYRAGVRAAESRYTAIQQERDNRANSLGTNLKLALFKYQDAERKITLYRDTLIPKANENLQVIQHSFETGASDFLSLIDAERILLEFKLTYERAIADREQGLAMIEQLTGGSDPSLSTADTAH